MFGLVVGEQVGFLLEVWVEFDLVDRRTDFIFFENNVEVRLEEVRDADRLCLAGGQDVFHLRPFHWRSVGLPSAKKEAWIRCRSTWSRPPFFRLVSMADGMSWMFVMTFVVTKSLSRGCLKALMAAPSSDSVLYTSAPSRYV
jgi:hypothetical protein